ncbi:MAG: hypothetical protein AAF368_05785, partial [Planctomycetota bacterium]
VVEAGHALRADHDELLLLKGLNLGKVRTEENALWSFAPHDIAVILRLVGGSPIQVVATGGCYVSPNIADTTVTQLLFDGGVRSHIYVSWLHPFKEQKLVVVGSKRMASFDDVAKELVLYDQRVEWQEGQPIPVKGDGVPVEREPKHRTESGVEERKLRCFVGPPPPPPLLLLLLLLPRRSVHAGPAPPATSLGNRLPRGR